MTDPTCHLVGKFLEINQSSGGPRYIRKDDIVVLNAISHRLTLAMRGRTDYETLTFVNLENQQRFVRQLLTDVSSDDTPFKDCVNVVKDAMEKIKSIQTDLNASLEDITSKIQEMKDDIKNDLQDYIDESLESEPEPEPEKKNPYDALDNTSTDTTCSILITLVSILLIIVGFVSIQKNLKTI